MNFIKQIISGTFSEQNSTSLIVVALKWATTRENLTLLHASSLVSVFVIRFLESMIDKLATRKISKFWLVCIAEQTILSLSYLVGNSKDGFLASRPILHTH